MTRDEVLDRLHHARGLLDRRINAIPPENFDVPVPGGAHSPKEILAHVASYEELIVGRLRAARLGETTMYDRDRTGWEIFNARVWAEAAGREPDEVRAHANHVYADLIREVVLLHDEELNEDVGITQYIDHSWLQARPLWELIGIDGFEHYPMHYSKLDRAATPQK